MFNTQVSGAIMAFLRIEPLNCIIQPNEEKKGGLYLGNIYAASNVDLLTKHDIGAVLTMGDLDITYENFKFIHHKKIECYDIETQDLLPFFDEAADFIKQELENTNVYVHCFAGVSRSTSAICAYYIKYKRQDFSKAFHYIKKRRMVAFPNLGFQRQLRVYERLVKAKRRRGNNNLNPEDVEKDIDQYNAMQGRSFSNTGKKMDHSRIKNRLFMFKKNNDWLNENQINTLTNVLKHQQFLKTDKPPIVSNNLYNSKKRQNNHNNNMMLGGNPVNNAILYSSNKGLTKQQKLREIEKKLNLEHNFEVQKKPIFKQPMSQISSYNSSNQKNSSTREKKKLPLLNKHNY